MLVSVWLPGSRPAHAQEAEIPVLTNTPLATKVTTESDTGLAKDIVVATKRPPAKQPVESDISVSVMIPDGDYRLFSATVRCKAWTVGVEYDRHSWGHFMGSRMDYVVEILPFMFLSQPVVSDFWGNAKSPNQELVPGVSISPFGFRWLWRDDKAVRPYIVGKLGTAVFAKKAFSPNASYANFNVQADFGVLIKMTERVDLRVDPFVFFHVSNGYLAASNPGMDELATKIGVSYRLGKKNEAR
jgi:Lipid A 3-O-deacylase (PagL)